MFERCRRPDIDIPGRIDLVSRFFSLGKWFLYVGLFLFRIRFPLPNTLFEVK